MSSYREKLIELTNVYTDYTSVLKLYTVRIHFVSHVKLHSTNGGELLPGRCTRIVWVRVLWRTHTLVTSSPNLSPSPHHNSNHNPNPNPKFLTTTSAENFENYYFFTVFLIEDKLD